MKPCLLPPLLFGCLLFSAVSSEQLTLGLSPAPQDCCPKHILYLLHTGNLTTSINAYQNYYAAAKRHDTEFLEQLGLMLLDRGWHSQEPEAQLMSLFGAAISLNEKAAPLLSQAIKSAHPKLQLMALQFLARWQDDDTERHMAEALRSNYLIVRLQAAAQMAKQRHRHATSHLESLMGKLESELHPLFPQLFAAVNDADSGKILKRLLNSPQEAVRIEAIKSAAKTGRDDLLPKIRIAATRGSVGELEACAEALSIFQDEMSVSRLQQLAHSSISSVRLAGLQALYKLGRKETATAIQAMAEWGDLYAIASLADISGSEKLLQKLLTSADLQIKLNAALSLLEKRDGSCRDFLKHVLIQDHRDFIFTLQYSPGKVLSCWKAIPSAAQNCEADSEEMALSQALREEVLAKTIDLPEEHFLAVVEQVLKARQNDLVPLAIQLLEQHHSASSIALLKRFQQYAGAPLIRNYCNLALCRLREETPYREILRTWVKAQANEAFLQLKATILKGSDDPLMIHQITPEETSRLLLEAFQYFAEKQDDEGINILLDAIKNGHPGNKYALAGLLIRASS